MKQKLAKKYVKYKALIKMTLMLVLIFKNFNSLGQTQAPPGYDWKAVTFREKDLMNNPVLTQTTSGDEWWYSHKNLLDANGNQIGYIAVGYIADFVKPGDETKMRNVFNEGTDSPFNLYALTGSLFTTNPGLRGSCSEFYNVMNASATTDAAEDRTEFRGMVARLDMKGNMIWCRLPTISGDGLEEVVQGNDGYIYVIGTHLGAKNLNFSNNNANRSFLPYNKTNSSPANFFDTQQYSSISTGSSPHMYIAKYDLDGVKQWEGLYGHTSFSNPNDAWNAYSVGYDLIINSNGSLYGVGRAPTSNSPSASHQLFVVKVDPSNGNLLSETLLPFPTSPNSYGQFCSYVEGRSICEIDANGNMAIGCKGDYPASNLDYQRGLVYSITPGLSLNSAWSANNPISIAAVNGAAKTSNIWEINYHNAKQEVLVGLITDCDQCAYTGNASGIGKIYRLKASDGSFSTQGVNPSVMGVVNAFDLRVGVIETSDGGFAAGSSRRQTTLPVPSLSTFGPTFSTCPDFVNSGNTTISSMSGNVYGDWDTDPLIVKFDANGNKTWEWNEDIVPGRTRQIPPGDFKRQECMYKLSEAQDKGLVISGNCSFNRDDNYMVKLYHPCNLTQTYDINGGMMILGNVTWNTSKKVIGKIIIKPGGILTITGSTTKIRFADSKMSGVPTYIEIEPGGKLEVTNGAELTSIDNTICPGSMWDGIAVLGNSFQGQGVWSNITSIPTQGFLYMNSATISNARCAVTTGTIDPYNIGAQDALGHTGGVVRAFNSYFIDNNRDVQMFKYINPNNYNMNKSVFSCCHFLINNKINNSENPVFRIYLNNVIGVGLKGNEFAYNAGNAYPPSDRGWGIKSDDAAYTVEDFCGNSSCSTYTQSTFSHLTMGIEADNCNYLRTVNVDHAIFNNTYMYASSITGGITLHNVATPQLKRNLITFADQFGYGISINNSKNYSVNNNTVHCTYSGNGVGIYLSNSGSGSHKVYRNTISHLGMGISPQYANSGCFNNTCNPNDGLIMNCNTFSNNTYDIAMLGPNTPGLNPSVRENQGILTNPLNLAKLVRNRYSNTTCTNYNKWYTENTSKIINHAAHLNSANNITQPNTPQASCASPMVSVYNSGVNFDPSHCPENESTPIVNPPSCHKCSKLADINHALGGAFSRVASLSSNYSNLLDGGNTQALLNLIKPTNSATYIKTQLTNSSPYLSDTVLKKYFNYSGTSVNDVIDIHNLNKPVTQSAWNVIMSRGFLPVDMAILEDQQTEDPLSDRRIAEDELGHSQAELQYIYGEKLNYFLGDTLETSTDSVIKLLTDNVGNLADAKTLRISAYANKGDYTRAFAYADSLNSIPEFTEIMTLQLALLQLDTALNGFNKIKTNPSLYGIITTYATDSTKAGSWLARAVLRQVYGNNMNLMYLYPSEGGARSMFQNQNILAKKSESEEIHQLMVYPNPSSSDFNVYYKTGEMIEVQYFITDILGKQLKAGRIKSNTVSEINTVNLSNGIYFLAVYKDANLLDKQKLILSK
jgi:hypothetical protein